jgi:hypothetical protein
LEKATAPIQNGKSGSSKPGQKSTVSKQLRCAQKNLPVDPTRVESCQMVIHSRWKFLDATLSAGWKKELGSLFD